MHRKELMTGRRRFMLGVGGAAVGTAFGRLAAAQDRLPPNDVSKRATPSVVVVEKHEEAAANKEKGKALTFGRRSGCGVVVQAMQGSLILTARHVIQRFAAPPDADQRRPSTRVIFLYFPEVRTPVRAKVVAENAEHDLALLRPLGQLPDNARPLSIAANNVQPTQQLTLIGKIVDPAAIDLGANREIEPDTCIVQFVNREGTRATSKFTVLVDGKSGAPVVDRNGAIAGVLIEQWDPKERLQPGSLKIVTPPPIRGFVEGFQQFNQFAVNDEAPEVLVEPPQPRGGWKQAGSTTVALPMPPDAPQVNAMTKTFDIIATRLNPNELEPARQSWLWAAASTRSVPGNLVVLHNDRVMRAVGGAGFSTDGADVKLESSFFGFDTLVGSEFMTINETLDLDKHSALIQCRLASGAAALKLHIAKVPFEVWQRGGVGANIADMLQDIVVQRRRDVVRLYLVNNDEMTLGQSLGGRERVKFGPVDNALAQSGVGNWSVISDTVGPTCWYRYRSYLGLDRPFERVVLYAYQVRSGRFFSAWFDAAPGAFLGPRPPGNQPVPKVLLEQWLFLLCLTIWP